jgi:hypothetical protein
MGAWGPRSFENDNAMDWLGELADTGDLTPIESALDLPPASADYVEGPECEAAVAAAEVVAALDGRPGDDLPEEVVNFSRGRPPPTPELLTSAKTAIRRVLDESELLDIWKESEEFESWRASMADLQNRLNRAG